MCSSKLRTASPNIQNFAGKLFNLESEEKAIKYMAFIRAKLTFVILIFATLTRVIHNAYRNFHF